MRYLNSETPWQVARFWFTLHFARQVLATNRKYASSRFTVKDAVTWVKPYFWAWEDAHRFAHREGYNYAWSILNLDTVKLEG